MGTPIYDALSCERGDVLAELAAEDEPDLAATISEAFSEVTAAHEGE